MGPVPPSADEGSELSARSLCVGTRGQHSHGASGAEPGVGPGSVWFQRSSFCFSRVLPLPDPELSPRHRGYLHSRTPVFLAPGLMGQGREQLGCRGGWRWFIIRDLISTRQCFLQGRGGQRSTACFSGKSAGVSPRGLMGSAGQQHYFVLQIVELAMCQASS